MTVVSILYFYVPGAYSVLEKATYDKEVRFRGEDSGKTFSELAETYPGIKLLTMEACEECIRAAAKSELEEISASTFSLYRESSIFDFHEDDHYSSFKCQEFVAADIATYVMSIMDSTGTRYFTFKDIDSLSHNEIISRGLKGCMKTAVDAIAS